MKDFFERVWEQIGTIRKKMLDCDFLLHRLMFNNLEA